MSGLTVPIALVLNLSHWYCRQVLAGIRQYSRSRDWMPYLIVVQPDLHRVLAQLKPKGIIVHAFNQSIAKAVQDLDCPVVNVSRTDPAMPFPSVNVEEMTVGSLAADHLIGCGLRHFGYFGPARYGRDSGREGGFYESLSRIPHTVDTFHTTVSAFDPGDTTSASVEVTRTWIRNLPKPAGIFTPSDTWSLWLSDICRQEGVHVPDEVAIIGVDNDMLVCELAQPSLSSIALPAERVGYQSAALLDRLMAGDAAPAEPELLPPIGVVARQSTDVLAVDDPDLVAAVRYIREHAWDPIAVTDIAHSVAMSRRTLERKFRAVLGHSPTEEIQRLRINRAKSLLESTDLQMPQVARKCGFSSAKQLSTVFQAWLGVAPSAYRRQMCPAGIRRSPTTAV